MILNKYIRILIYKQDVMLRINKTDYSIVFSDIMIKKKFLFNIHFIIYKFYYKILIMNKRKFNFRKQKIYYNYAKNNKGKKIFSSTLMNKYQHYLEKIMNL